MYRATLALAMIAPARQLTFRWAATFHLLAVALLTGNLHRGGPIADVSATLLGQGLIILAIIEGAVLIGWRLTQLPRSQALEFLLVSPVPPRHVFGAEAAAGAGRLTLLTLAGVPVLLLGSFSGRLTPLDVVVVTMIPLLVGLLTGVGLAAWAYESRLVRRIGEVFGLMAVLVYLTVGLLAGERLIEWLRALPEPFGRGIYLGIQDFKNYNPFGVIATWMKTDELRSVAWSRVEWLTGTLIGLVGLTTMRAGWRLKGHYRDRHYTPATTSRSELTHQIQERPLSWWAVRRVMEYSGKVNLWLAGGFGVMYAAYIMAGDAWPPWMGRVVFQMFESMGGAPALITGLVMLAAVPAAFQYGLWDSGVQERCRRLELLLLTDLRPGDYWHAAWAAAWRRGRGYMVVAILLWMALWLAHQVSLLQVVASISSAVVLWSFTFAVGFRAFTRGAQANGLGSLLTLGMPAATVVLVGVGVPFPTSLLPPGAVYASLVAEPNGWWLIGPVFTGAFTIWLTRYSLRRADTDLRNWYSDNQGRKAAA